MCYHAFAKGFHMISHVETKTYMLSRTRIVSPCIKTIAHLLLGMDLVWFWGWITYLPSQVEPLTDQPTQWVLTSSGHPIDQNVLAYWPSGRDYLLTNWVGQSSFPKPISTHECWRTLISLLFNSPILTINQVKDHKAFDQRTSMVLLGAFFYINVTWNWWNCDENCHNFSPFFFVNFN